MAKNIICLFCLLLFSNGFSQDLVAIDSLSKEIKQYQKVNKNPTLADTVAVKTYAALSRCYRDFEPEKCVFYANQSMALAKKINYPHGIAIAHCSLGNVCNNKGDFYQAISHFNEAIAITTKIHHKLLFADSNLLLGQSYLYLNNFPEALRHIQMALSGYEKLDKKPHICRALNNLGILYKKQSKNELALKHYYKALAILKTVSKNQESETLANAINGNIAHVYSDQKKHRESLEILLKCLPVYIKFNRLNNCGLNYQAIGINYLELDEYDKAFSSFSSALEMFRKMNNKSGEADVLRHLGEYYFETNNLPKAIEFSKQGLVLSMQIGELESIKFGYENLAKFYSKSGNYELAYESQIGYKKYSDSIINSESNKKLIQLQMTNAFEKQQAALKKEQQRKDAMLKSVADKERRIKYITMLSLFFLSILTIGIYLNLKRNQKQRAIIGQQKEQIEHSLHEKETLLREIHHRVKNNLQIISSLLNMQAEEINDDAVLASIREGQSRVQAMSLIHQNLYQSEEINKVDVENYFKELIDYLSEMFGGKAKNIQVKIKTANIAFDFDTAIPLGLIVNELVSNAYKYAFQSKKSGTIHIDVKAVNNVDYELRVGDDGGGLPDGFDIKKSESLGLKLVSILSKQLRGNFLVETTAERTTFVVLFKDLKAYNA